MGRPSGLTDSNSNTWVNSAAYDYAGRLQTLNYLGVTETRGYNTVGQIASIGWSNSNQGQLSGTLTYTYPSGQNGVYKVNNAQEVSYNNGQISQMTDSISGETTVYQYDALKRVVSASNGVWNETFSYDGFGNLTGKTLNGNPQSISVNSATNQLSGPSYDLNGNMTVGAGATMTYNEDNRMSSAQVASGSVEYYYYTPDGKRFCRTMANGDTQYTLYGLHGEALGTYAIYADTEVSVYFGGRRLWQAPYYNSANGSKGAVFADRLGSNRYVTTSPSSYPTYYTDNFYPYGDAAGTASQDQVGFATYTQDSYTGLDYADHRMYANTYGRFNTPDPYAASGGPSDPGSWNRYSYTLGDPINRFDPTGRDAPVACGGFGDEGEGFASSDCGIGGGYYSGGGCAIIDELDPLPDPACYTLPEQNAPTQPKPKCDSTSVNAQFLAANYGSAAVLSVETNVPLDWILAWAAQESGGAHGEGWGQSGAALQNQNYFGQRTSNWPGAVPCGSNAVAGWACFSGFLASATSALDTVHKNWTFNGQSGVTAAQILTSFGSDVAAAFQAVSNAGQVGSDDPRGTHYGSDIANILPGVDARLNCLGLIIF